MSKNQKTFVDLCLDGRAMLTEIDDYVDCWHEDPQGQSLAASLGMTESEYAVWVEKPIALRHILFARKNHTRLEDTFKLEAGQHEAIAARAGSPSEVQELYKWLKQTGRI
jgi:hypothetical protein